MSALIESTGGIVAGAFLSTARVVRIDNRQYYGGANSRYERIVMRLPTPWGRPSRGHHPFDTVCLVGGVALQRS